MSEESGLFSVCEVDGDEDVEQGWSGFEADGRVASQLNGHLTLAVAAGVAARCPGDRFGRKAQLAGELGSAVHEVGRGGPQRPDGHRSLAPPCDQDEEKTGCRSD